MAVAALTGHGDPDALALLRARHRRCRTGRGTGCSRVAIHFDVDTIDSHELGVGLGAEPGGLTSDQARRIVRDVEATADVVGLTIAEFFPRQVMHLQQLLAGFPLTASTGAAQSARSGRSGGTASSSTA